MYWRVLRIWACTCLTSAKPVRSCSSSRRRSTSISCSTRATSRGSIALAGSNLNFFFQRLAPLHQRGLHLRTKSPHFRNRCVGKIRSRLDAIRFRRLLASRTNSRDFGVLDLKLVAEHVQLNRSSNGSLSTPDKKSLVSSESSVALPHWKVKRRSC
jgi:hypothetical protein